MKYKLFLCKWWQSCSVSVSGHFPSPGSQEHIAKPARSVANHACSRTPCQLSSAQSESRKWSPGSSEQGDNRGCRGNGFPAGCHFCLIKGKQTTRLLQQQNSLFNFSANWLWCATSHGREKVSLLQGARGGSCHPHLHNPPLPGKGAEWIPVPHRTRLLHEGEVSCR